MHLGNSIMRTTRLSTRSDVSVKPGTHARRTRCSAAVLAAIGLLSTTRAGAAPAGTTLAPAIVPVLRGVVSDYANSATFSTAPNAGTGGQTLTINQLLPKIILNWSQFNVGNGSIVEFVQPSSTSAVLNRIFDSNPSIIQGQIKANGQVYLVNQNGILFDRGAQVDVNTLVASSLNIDDAIFQKSITTGRLFSPAFSGGYDDAGRTIARAKTGSIVIGANGSTSAAAPQLAARSGGAIVLIAPIIDNQTGVITSPDGQVILAAGRSVYLGFNEINDNSLRGMLVEVTAGGDPINVSSLIKNAGLISSDRGNVTLAGLAINQSGRISASSAMLANGSVYLQARALGDAQRGTVNLATGSVIETPLDTTDTTTLRESDSYVPYRSVVKIQGAQIFDSGRIASPGGNVSIDAKDPSVASSARIYLAPESQIDASGAWSDSSDSTNFLTFKVTSNELKNSPDQKDGILHGATVTVDLRTGSSLLDLSGYQQNQARTLAQKAAAGGAVTLTTTGDLIQRAGSTIDVSGGGVRYSSGTEATSRLLGADGKVYDIGTAPEMLQYTAVADSFTQFEARWGINTTFSNLLPGSAAVQPAYVQGAAGGTLTVGMGKGQNGLVLDGSLRGGVTVGSHQLASPPAGSTLSIGTVDPTKTAQDFGIGDVNFRPGVLSSLPAGFSSTSKLSADAEGSLSLSTDIFSTGFVDAFGNYTTSGFGAVAINANGRILVPNGVTLGGAIGGALALQANQVEIDGRIVVPSGSFTAATFTTPGTSLSPPAASAVTLGATGFIDARGSWTNNYLAGVPSPVPTTVVTGTASSSAADGGAVTLSGPVITLARGSSIDVSAGGLVSTTGKITGGAGGSLVLAATGQSSGSLELDGSLAAFGFSKGGKLSLATGTGVQIGVTADPSYGLHLDPSFFDAGGFQQYGVAAGKDLLISAGTTIHPQQTSLQFINAETLLLPSGSNPALSSRQVVLPDYQRTPVSMNLTSAAALTMQTGSALVGDTGAAFTFSAGAFLSIDGAVSAPSGSIAATLSAPDQPGPTPSLVLGSHGSLIAAGTYTATPSDQGLVQGTVGVGGTVSFITQRATLELRPGSIVDVSGTRQVIDVTNAIGSIEPYHRSFLASNAGTVSITADDAVSLGGTLRGSADSTAAGGSFALTLSDRGDFADPTSGRRIVVTQSGTSVAPSASFKDAAISTDKLLQGGFDKLRLTSEDEIFFAGTSSLRFDRGLTLDSKRIEVGSNANVMLSSSQVTLRNTFGERVPRNPGDSSDPRTVNDPTQASLPRSTSTGNGVFSVNAGTLDLLGSVTISGTSSERLSAQDDLRLSGRAVGSVASPAGATLVGSLTAAGDMSLSAAQIYPTTASAFSIAVADGLTGVPTPGGRVDIAGSGAIRGAVLSAGGSLVLSADDIVQGGVVKAPLGKLAFNAGRTLTLAPGSITSVSADGLTIPYGETQAGVTWTYAATGNNPLTNALTAPPAKRIALSAPIVDVQSGATVDVSGGGDVVATEFVPGSGGTTNALVQPNTYAILPAAQLTRAPIDPDIALGQNLGFGSDSAVYNSVRIGAGGPVPAGDYVLLPGYYALLSGGYVVQLLKGSAYAALQPEQTTSLANGLTVVPGVLTASGTGVSSSATVGVIVRPGSDVPKLADYTVTPSSYFADLAAAARASAPSLPVDGGQLSIAASSALKLDGNLVATLPSLAARSADVDIAASKIALVDATGSTDIANDYLQIDAASLSKLDASLLIGGVRTSSASGLTVTPSASSIVVANTSAANLSAPELILAATDSIDIQAGSSISTSGATQTTPRDLVVAGPGAGSGAIVRLANSSLVSIQRPVTTATQGTVTIDAGALLASTGSLLIDATLTTSSRGTLAVAKGGSLGLVSGTISLGETAGVETLGGLVLDNAELASFNALGTLALKSYHGIDLYGSANIGSASLARLVIDSPAITGHASSAGATAQATLSGGLVSLISSSPGTGTGNAPIAGASTFAINAGQITLGAGDKSISGYSSAVLTATADIVASDTGTLLVAAPLQLLSARITSSGGANQTWTAQIGSAYQPVTISALNPAVPLTSPTGFGSRLGIVGSSITDAGQIVMKSGSIALDARGPGAADGVQVQASSVLDASGASKDFQGTTSVVDGGQVTLTAAHGSVSAATGSSIDVSAAAPGGNAGSLAVVASTASIDGMLKGDSAKGSQASFSLDVATGGDIAALNSKLNVAGFTESRSLRVRGGDLTIAAGDVVQAHHVVLESDAGSVLVSGRVDASSSLGAGSIDIFGKDVTLSAGSLLDASATSPLVDSLATATLPAVVAPFANGGSVTAVADGGTLAFQSGALIDVRAGAKGGAGSVLLRAPRIVNGVQATLAGQVLSQRHPQDAATQIVVEANRVYDVSTGETTLAPATIAQFASDNLAFMSGRVSKPADVMIRGDDGMVVGAVQVRPAVEVRNSGDLTIASNWDLTTPGWTTHAAGSTTPLAGTLILRAAGTVTLSSASLGNPDESLPSTPTWNIGITSGADLSASNPFAVQAAGSLAAQSSSGRAGAGDLVLDSAHGEASIRTGTGNVHLSAGRDFVIRAGVDPDTSDRIVGVVYTSGTAAIPDPLTARSDSRFVQNGGDVLVSAQRDAIGAGNEWMTEWFRSATQDDGGLTLGAWWAYRANFHDGIGALGGGTVTLVAGRDISNVSAWAPTSAIEVGTGNAGQLRTFGGGDVSVRAGNDIDGGQYMASLGNMILKAGGAVGSTGPATQVFAMGATGDASLAPATVQVSAGSSVRLATIDNPSSLFQSQLFGSDVPSFNAGNELPVLSYSSLASASVVAKSGDVLIGNRPIEYLALNPDDQSTIHQQLSSAASPAVLPPRVAITALQGSIRYTGTSGGQTLFPSTSGGVKLLAGQDVTGTNILVSDADPTLFAIASVPTDVTPVYGDLLRTFAASPNRVVTNTFKDTFVNDVVALNGSVRGVTLTFPSRSRIWAAQDILDPVLALQNLQTADQSQIVANAGSVTIIRNTSWGIGGPGSLLIQAGENIDLGTASLASFGNQQNASLTTSPGASLSLVAGVGHAIDVSKLDSTFAALIAAGGENNQTAADAAISALVGPVAKGSINSYNTSIQSNAGGDINLLAPGGNITVGLTTPNTQKLIGIVTNAGGAIRSFLSGDFDINQGKVLTAQGGDILIYTSGGSIDAGRGAKTSVTTPPPRRTPVNDADGNLIGYQYTLPVAVAGSGIQTVTSRPNGPTSTAPPAGNIYLFAPAGTIDAGEAGIASGGNIFIVALTVLNADNITSAGTSVGVPTPVVGSVASSLASSGATTAASASTDANVAAQSAAAAAQAAAATSFRPAILTVEVLGFGEKNCKETDKDCFAK